MSSLSQEVLAVSLRPTKLSELVGQEKIVKCLLTQEESGRTPHFYIISGESGSGKTTLARIIAKGIQLGYNYCGPEVKGLDIKEINAANENSIEFIRKLIETMKFKPNNKCKGKIVIMDEAHKITDAAQNALLTETEECNGFYIFCTTAPNKIIPALRRRAFIISPELLNNETISTFVKKICLKYGKNVDSTDLFLKEIIDNNIRSPGIILQCIERYFAGMSVEEAVTFKKGISTAELKVNTLVICQSIVKGNWKLVSTNIKNIDKSELFALRVCILGYLKTVLLKKSDDKAIPVAKAIKLISEANVDEIAPFLANVCLATFFF